MSDFLSGRSQRSIEAGRRDGAEDQAGGVLGKYDIPEQPSCKRSSGGEANASRNHGEVQREESIPRSSGENKDVLRKNKGKRKYYPKRNAKQ